ncbi:YkgJ family cysteine cluster protein [Dongia sp.]|uniref:YkgJ family cysteine cluster protein n=1 Tax=Dongia sp. TaxID=1977262 RepID=UPI0035B00FD0
MGQAKRRKAEIEKLKQQSLEDAANWRRHKRDQLAVSNGIQLDRAGAKEGVAAMARELIVKLKKAKAGGSLAELSAFLNDSVDKSIAGLGPVPIACKKGCSHCCNIWVSATAPEVLTLANVVRLRGDAAVKKVRDANEVTKAYPFEIRDSHPHPCPLLENDLCTVYEHRPKACRLAASANAEICGRSYRNTTNEDIPTPFLYLMGRSAYALAFAAALQKSALPYHAYELNAALVRVLDTEDAEHRWLSGEDIFAGVMQDPEDVLSSPDIQSFLNELFASNSA